MLMTAGDKDSLKVTAQCPPAAHSSHKSGFLQRADIPLRTNSLPGIGNPQSLNNVYATLLMPSFAVPHTSNPRELRKQGSGI